RVRLLAVHRALRCISSPNQLQYTRLVHWGHRSTMMAFSVEYVAGLFDGEGCIHIGRRKRGIRLPQFFLQVSITMAHTMILELEEFTGGYTQTIMRDLHIPGRRRIHTISWT